jgi:hypothetical protein
MSITPEPRFENDHRDSMSIDAKALYKEVREEDELENTWEAILAYLLC